MYISTVLAKKRSTKFTWFNTKITQQQLSGINILQN